MTLLPSKAAVWAPIAATGTPGPLSYGDSLSVGTWPLGQVQTLAFSAQRWSQSLGLGREERGTSGHLSSLPLGPLLFSASFKASSQSRAT